MSVLHVEEYPQLQIILRVLEIFHVELVEVFPGFCVCPRVLVAGVFFTNNCILEPHVGSVANLCGFFIHKEKLS